MGSSRSGMHKNVSEVFRGLGSKRDIVIQRLVSPKTLPARRQTAPQPPSTRPQNPLIPPAPGSEGAPSWWWQKASGRPGNDKANEPDSSRGRKSGLALCVPAHDAISLMLLGLCIGIVIVLLTMGEPPVLLLACISISMYILGMFAGKLNCLKNAVRGNRQKIVGVLVILGVLTLAVSALMIQSLFLLSFGVLLAMGFVGLFAGGL